MNNDPITGCLLAALRGVAIAISNRALLKYLLVVAYILFFSVICMLWPISTKAADFSAMDRSPEKIISQMKDRLHLTEEQETKIRSIIEEGIRKRHDILDTDSQDRKAVRSQLQQLRWSTDMQIGKLLTEEQMKEYQKLREEESEKEDRNDM